MGRQAPRPPHYREHREEPQKETKLDIVLGTTVQPPGYEPPPPRALLIGLILFWVAVILGIALLYSCRADAGMLLFLEGEDDLGNGYKLCHYTEGYTITIQSHKLCPLSINTGD